MNKAVVSAGVLICAALLFTGAQAQRSIVPGDGSAVSEPAPVPVVVANTAATTVVDGVVDVRRIRRPVEVTGTVAVSNLPAVQNVAGGVAITNLPALQSVAGSVAVSNLPLDADGNVRVSNVPAIGSGPRHLLGVTQNSFGLDQGLFAAARACHSDFPGSRPCTTAEIVGTVNPPALPAGQAWVLPVQAFYGLIDSPVAVDPPTGAQTERGAQNLTCNGYSNPGNGVVVDQDGRFIRVHCDLLLPVACCGY